MLFNFYIKELNLRLWSLHPKYADSPGLNGLWREALLAQKVLQGRTKGYTKHSQLQRFRGTRAPLNALGYYLQNVWKEANQRGFKYNRSKICKDTYDLYITVTDQQVDYERDFLLSKLKARKSDKYLVLKEENEPELHPLFFLVGGPIETWEKIKEFES